MIIRILQQMSLESFSKWCFHLNKLVDVMVESRIKLAANIIGLLAIYWLRMYLVDEMLT